MIAYLASFAGGSIKTGDGKRVFEDITYPDSFGREFYALVDGSYLTVENGVTTLYGEAYLIKDGVLSQVCRDGESRLME